MSNAELKQLASEIRQELIDTVSQTGGHLAPNLGVVELTIALHRAFRSPQDKLVWDVGHQAYTHKLLTGRRSLFHSLRQSGGLSGFPKRSESVHDAFGTGHSSTSISAALGLALARDHRRENGNVIAVIGDGSLTGGQAYEALNHAGHLGTNLIVVLNDNEMSIAKNVGAMSEYLAKIRLDPQYAKLKHDVEQILRRIPAIGERVADTVERVKDSLRCLLVPGMLFKELGFHYIGPIDGHNIEMLLDVFEKSPQIGGPVLIHVLTCKGKGYEHAEKNADQFHGVGPFCIVSGKSVSCSTVPTYTAVFGGTLCRLAEKDTLITAITAAMPDGTGLGPFAKQFPARFIDVGIAEQHAVTLAAGMAAGGLKPVIAVYSTFLQRAYDHILHDVCLQNLPVVFAIDRAGLVGEDGPTHHGVFDIAFLRHIPNLVLLAPKDENELQHMLYSALRYDCPVAIRYPRGVGIGVQMEAEWEEISLGSWEILRQGTDLTLIACGTMVAPALQAADLLAEAGISSRVINGRFIKPLDQNLLQQLQQEGNPIVTVEEHVLAGGFGSAVLEYLNTLPGKALSTLCLGIPDEFVGHGARGILLKQLGLTAQGIAEHAANHVNPR